MLNEAMPIPEAMTLIGMPFHVPVHAPMPRTSLTRVASVRKPSAIRAARRGSPGMRTNGAMSPGSAVLCGVAM